MTLDRFEWMAMFGNGRAARHDFHILFHQLLRRSVHIHVQQVRIAVKVVVILKKRKIETCLDIGIRFVHGQPRGEIDSSVFIADCRFELCLVGGAEPINPFLFLLFTTATNSQGAADFVIVTVTMEVVPEHGGFNMDAVHENNTDFGVGIDFHLIVRFGVEVIPIKNSF